MPSRIVREGILSSERVNALSLGGEVFYRRLLSIVDDYGRFTANLTLIRTSCYPLRVDTVKEPEIEAYLSECVSAGLIKHYSVKGKAFLEVQDFKQQVRAKESKYPPPDVGSLIKCTASDKQTIADAKQMITDVHLDVVVVEDVFGGVAESDLTCKASDSQKPPTAAALLSIAMRECGIESQPGDPRIIALASQNVAIETVKAACVEAKRQKPDERISPGLVISIVERWAKQAAAVQAVGAKPPESKSQPIVRSPLQQDRAWSDPGLEARGRKVGIDPLPGEARNEFDDRVYEAEVERMSA